eukprot:6491020-Amphidinium_carterae.4
MEVDQGASPKAMSKEGSKAGFSDMAATDIGGIPTIASTAGLRQFQGRMLTMTQQSEYMLNRWKVQRGHVEVDSARYHDLGARIQMSEQALSHLRQSLAQIHQYDPASSPTTEAETNS